jgi:integrase
MASKLLYDMDIINAKPQEKDYFLKDGDGLYLFVTTQGYKHWKYKYSFEAKKETLSIGSYPKVSLKKARTIHTAAVLLKNDGINPNDKKREDKAQKRQPKSTTFESIAAEYIAKKTKDKKSKSYLESITNKLAKNVFPKIGKTPIDNITRLEVTDLIKFIDNRSPDTADKCLQYIKAVFAYAEDLGVLEGNRVATIKIGNVITNKETIQYKHIADPRRFGELLKAIDDYKGEYSTKSILRFMPLVLCRPTEVREATWSEIDFENELWTIPAERMKMKTAHVVPLSKQAIKILLEILPYTKDKEAIFASPLRSARFLSENTVTKAIKIMGFKDEHTAHGFRHSGSTMLHDLIEVHGAHTLIIESCLAHKDKNEVRGIYNKAEYIPQRRALMQFWSDHLDTLKAGE